MSTHRIAMPAMETVTIMSQSGSIRAEYDGTLTLGNNGSRQKESSGGSHNRG
jgi:hypothetical protein